MRNSKISRILKYSPSEECIITFHNKLSRSLFNDLTYCGQRLIYESNVVENVIALSENIHTKSAFDFINKRIEYLIDEKVRQINSDDIFYKELRLDHYKVFSSKEKDQLVDNVTARIRKVKSLNLICYFAKYPKFAIDCACHGNKLLHHFKESDYEKINYEIHKTWSRLYFKNHPNLNSHDRTRYIPDNLYTCEKIKLQKYYTDKINAAEDIEKIRSTFKEASRIVGEYFLPEQLKDAIRKYIFNLAVTDIEQTVENLKEPEVALCDKKNMLDKCIPLINIGISEKCLQDIFKLCIYRQDHELKNSLFKRVRLICKRFLTLKITDDKSFSFFNSLYSISRNMQADPESHYSKGDLRELEMLPLLVLLSFRGNYQDINEPYLKMSIGILESGLDFVYKNYYGKIPKLKSNKHYLLANVINIIDNYDVSRFEEEKKNRDIVGNVKKMNLAAKDKLDTILSTISEKDISGKDSLDYLKTYRKLSNESKMNLIQIYMN